MKYDFWVPTRFPKSVSLPESTDQNGRSSNKDDNLNLMKASNVAKKDDRQANDAEVTMPEKTYAIVFSRRKPSPAGAEWSDPILTRLKCTFDFKAFETTDPRSEKSSTNNLAHLVKEVIVMMQIRFATPIRTCL